MSTTDPSAETEAEWDAVTKTRIDEIEAGTARLMPLEDVEAEMDAFVAALPVCPQTWPQDFLREIRIDDAAFERPAQEVVTAIDPLDA